MPAGSRRRPRTVAILASVAAALVVVLPGPARAASADESRLVDLSNAVRASAGVPALTVDATLSTVAQAWAATMAGAGTISHNPALSTRLTGWTKIAENVGMGPDLDTVHRALVASPPHHANLVDPELTLIGVGVVNAGGNVFVVEDFMRPANAATVVTTTPPPSTSTPRATAPPPTAARPRPTTTTTVPLARAASPTPPSTAVAAAPPPEAQAGPPPEAPAAPSEWLALALEVTRGWERAAR